MMRCAFSVKMNCRETDLLLQMVRARARKPKCTEQREGAFRVEAKPGYSQQSWLCGLPAACLPSVRPRLTLNVPVSSVTVRSSTLVVGKGSAAMLGSPQSLSSHGSTFIAGLTARSCSPFLRYYYSFIIFSNSNWKD